MPIICLPVGTGAGRGSGRLCGALGSDKSADVDEVVSDNSGCDPAFMRRRHGNRNVEVDADAFG